MSLDKIYKMLDSNNVELKSEKIELGKLDDLLKERKDAAGSIMQVKKELTSALSKMSKEIKRLSNVEAEAKSIVKQLKELGIDNQKIETLAESTLSSDWKSSQSKIEAAIKSI